MLRDIVHQRTGIFFDADRLDTLLDKVEPLAVNRGCKSLLDFYYLLKYEENGLEDWNQLIDAISVQETYFWREMAQIRAFVDILVPEWFAKSSQPLRVWSAACATGEEPFTIAMALVEKGWGGHPIEIHATDASYSALQKAGTATYREKSFRTLPSELRRKYFTPVAGGSKLDPAIANRVQFARANLLAPEDVSIYAHANVIFCRNVFIYFSAHAIRQTVATIASRIPANGHLFVGAAESLLKMTSDFSLRQIGDAYGYVRI